MLNYKIVTDELIGVDCHVREVRDLLDLDSKALKVVGIHGMGGIGKTTISKAVYNEVSSQFERSCFLEDIRETLLENDGVVTLQNKIISRILRHDSHVKDTSEGIHAIKDKVCKYKVFIVLDDVDQRFEFGKIFGKLQDFSLGSRFIITTRDRRVLDFFEECRLFEAKEMSHNDSYQLFKKHAFGMDDLQDDKELLCEEFVKLAGGLPLALKIIGSLLFRKERRFWEEKLEELKERPSSRVHEILKISYNDLSTTEKEIFLDIACFFIGKPKELPFYMWSDCKYYPERGLGNLILRSLIKISDTNQFLMHDHIRDLGRAIVREDNIQQSWKQSRIWSKEEALDMLENGQGNDKVEVLRINMEDGDNLKLTEKEFKNLSGVRFLQVTGGRMTGDFSKVLPNVRWLQLDHCRSIPDDVNLKKVVILNLEQSSVRNDWRGWKGVKEGKKLKVINLRRCEDLLEAPDLSSCSRLEVINLDLCSRMGGELHIGNSKNLKLLSLSSSKITKLIGDIGMFQDLKEIDASSLKELPAGISKLTSLEVSKLIFSQLEVRAALPTSLKKLELSSSSVPNLLELKDLEELSFEHCRDELEIPGDVWLHLTKLKRLTVSYSHCKSLLLKVELVVGSSSTSSSNRIMGDSVVQLPSSLNSLAVVSCQELETLPNLENLCNLTELRLGSVLVDEIRGLRELRMLECLEISKVQKLKSLDGLQNLVLLQRLTVDCCGALEILPSLSNLTKLHTLEIRHCGVLFEIQGMDALIMGEYSLTNLEVSWCPRLANVGDLVQSLQALQILKLKNFRALETLLLCLPSFTNLKTLTVEETPDHGLDSTSVPSILILNLFGLGNLQVVNISRCQQLTEITGFETLHSLEKLDISCCSSMQKLSNLSALKNLKTLRIWDSTQLIELEGLDQLESLEQLEMYGCTLIEKLPNLCNLKKLKGLSIKECTSLKLTEDCGLDGLNSLQWLKISRCTSVLKLPNLFGLTNLTDLDITGCTELTDVMGLEKQESLVRLFLNDCASLVRLPDLSKLKNLKVLYISGCTELTEIIGLESVELLQVLTMVHCKSMIKLPDLSSLEYLRYLNISGCTQLTKVIGVERLESLEVLDMSHCKSINELSDISGLRNLKHLDIRGCGQLADITGMDRLKSLQVLGVHDSTSASGWMDPFANSDTSDLHWKYLMYY